MRGLRSGPLPGLTLVAYDPQWAMVTDVIPCEDGHAQERALLAEVLPLVQPRDVWVADRNFCTTGFLFAIAARQGFFVIRQHAQTLQGCTQGKRHYCGRSETGKVYEQAVQLWDEQGNILTARRITVALDQPTRDGDTELHILTNLPQADADGLVIAELYRGRWTIESAFGELAAVLSAEIDTLAYPKAALFCFCVGLAAYNVLGVIKGALRAAHGEAKVTEEVSAYYVANEMARTYAGMMIAIPEDCWRKFAGMTAKKLGRVLKELAGACVWRRCGNIRAAPRGRSPRNPGTRNNPMCLLPDSWKRETRPHKTSTFRGMACLSKQWKGESFQAVVRGWMIPFTIAWNGPPTIRRLSPGSRSAGRC